MLKPSDVFTPGRPPLDATNVYAARGDAERVLRTALERNMFPVIFGDYGVGKTSMARHVLAADAAAGRLVNVESVSGKSFADIVNQLLEHVGYTVVREMTKKDTAGVSFAMSASIGGEVGVPGNKVSGKVGVSGASSSALEDGAVRSFLVTAPSDSKLLSVCENHGLVLLLDEMHHADKRFVADVSSFLKAMSNKPCKKFRVVLLGTSHDASRLVSRDYGIDRLVQEVELGSLATDEARHIVTTGMTKLAISFDAGMVDQLVDVAVGSPALVQYLALEVAEAAFVRKPRKANADDLRDAIKSYVGRREKRLEESYLKAAETMGEKRYRKQIMLAMAALRDDFVTMEQLSEQVSKQVGGGVPSTALSGPLRSLKDDYRILRDVEHREGGDRVYNFTAFEDPMMKSFLRLRAAAVKGGLLR